MDAIVPVADALFSLDTLIEADRLAKSAPARVTDLHLAHLAHYVTPAALTDIIRRRADAVVAAANADAADQQRAAIKSAPPANLDGVTTFEELCAAVPQQPVTFEVLGAYHTFILKMNEANNIRNTKIRALEARVAELETAVAARSSRAGDTARPMAGATLQ